MEKTFRSVRLIVPGEFDAEAGRRIAEAYRAAYPGREPTRRSVKLCVAVHPGIPSATKERTASSMGADRLRPMGRPHLDAVLSTVVWALRGLAYVSCGQVVSCVIIKRWLVRPEIRVELIDMDADQGAI